MQNGVRHSGKTPFLTCRADYFASEFISLSAWDFLLATRFGELLGQLGGGRSLSGGDGGAQLLLDGFEFAGAHAVAEVGLLTGAQTLESGFRVSHFSFFLTFSILYQIDFSSISMSIRKYHIFPEFQAKQPKKTSFPEIWRRFVSER